MTLEDSISILNEKNFWFYLKRFAESQDNYYSGDFEYSWVKSIFSDWPNFVYRIKFDKTLHPEDLYKHFTKRIKFGEIPTFLAIGPGSMPDEIAEILNYGPFQLVDMWPGMVLEDYKKLNLKEIQGFDISEVNDEKSLNDWLTIIKSEFFTNKIIQSNIFINLLQDQKIKMFLGFFNNIPVATSMSVNDGNTLGLYMIATKKEYRKLGIGFNMTITPIIESLKSKLNLPVILQATTIGKNVYESIGFREVCNFFIFKTVDQ